MCFRWCVCDTLIDENHIQYESGYLVETVVEGNDLGMVPYSIRVSHDGELYAVDEVNSNIVKITPPLSQCKHVYVHVFVFFFMCK